MPADSFRRRLESFVFAFQGAKTLLFSQPNARIHALATVAVLTAGGLCRVARSDWALLAVAIALVWIGEAFNTAVEFLADEITLERRWRIKQAKDLAAFGVFAGAATAVVIGLLVFLPYLVHAK